MVGFGGKTSVSDSVVMTTPHILHIYTTAARFNVIIENKAKHLLKTCTYGRVEMACYY